MFLSQPYAEIGSFLHYVGGYDVGDVPTKILVSQIRLK
jgi:hypothetical protein